MKSNGIIKKLNLCLFLLLICFLIIPKNIYAAELMEINDTNDLVNLLGSGEQKNKKIVIKDDITIKSDQIPDIGHNVNLTNCIVTGVGEKRPTITIETKEQEIQPLFGKILGNAQDVTDGKGEYPVLQNFNIVCKGDVIGSAVCAEVDAQVGNDFKKYDHLGYAKNIGIEVNGNIIPYEYYTNNYKAGAFAIDWTEFDFYNIDINVNGNIGDENEIYDKTVLVGGLFAENGGYKTIRLENINIKAKNLIAKTSAKDHISAAAGIAVTGESSSRGKVKVFAKKVNVDVENIISSNATCSNGKMNSFASLGFLDNTKTFVTNQTMMAVSIGIAPWPIHSYEVELGVNYPVETMKKTGANTQLFSLPTNVNEDLSDPFFIKMNQIAGGFKNQDLLVYPRVSESKFKANNVEVTSAGNCGGVYYGVGNIMNVLDTSISVGKIKMNTNLPNFAGISASSYFADNQGEFEAKTSNNNMTIGNIEVNPIEGSFATKDAYLSLVGHVGSDVSKNNINVGDIKINLNNDNLVKINAGLDKAYTVKDNDIKIKSLYANSKGSKNNLGKIAFSGLVYGIDMNEKTGMTVENNRLALDGDIDLKGNAGSFFAGMIKDDYKGVLKNNTAIFKNINLNSNRFNEFSGIMSSASSSSSTIENNSLQVLGNIRLKKSILANYLAGILLEDTGNCSMIKDNTLLVMGSVINEGSAEDKEDFTSLGVGYVDWTGAGTQILGNAIYVHDKIVNGPSVNFSYLAENFLIDNYYKNNKDKKVGIFALKNNSIMLRNIPDELKDESLANGAMSVGAEGNVFVHVHEVNRDAYKIDGNGKLNMDKENLIGTMKIAPRDFQDKLWTNGSSDQGKKYDFDYILNTAELKQLDFISRDKDELLNGGDGAKLSLNDFYRRHLAAKNGEVIYDILGIPSEGFIVKYDLNGGSLIDPSKPIEDKNYYSLGEEAIVLSAENAAYGDRKFLGWSLDKNAEKGEYLPESKIEMNGNITLYAIWEGPKEPGNVVPVVPEERKDKPLFPWLEIGNYENYDADKKEDPKTHIAYIFGYPDKTIRPEGNITRAEAAALVIRLAELDTKEKLGKFEDTEVEAWYNEYVNLAYEKDMLLAEDKKIRPNEKITRAEFAKLISKVDKENSKELPFEDVKGHQFEKEIQQAYANGRIEGYPDGSFKPDGEITRTEAVKILNSLFERSADKDYINDNQDKIKKFIDLDRNHWGYYELVEAANTHKYVRREAGKVDERWLEILEYIEKNIK